MEMEIFDFAERHEKEVSDEMAVLMDHALEFDLDPRTMEFVCLWMTITTMVAINGELVAEGAITKEEADEIKNGYLADAENAYPNDPFIDFIKNKF